MCNSKILVDYGVQNNNTNNNNNHNNNDDDDDNCGQKEEPTVLAQHIIIYNVYVVSFVSLACTSSKTHNLQAVLFFSYLVHKMTVVVPGVPGGDCGNWE